MLPGGKPDYEGKVLTEPPSIEESPEGGNEKDAEDAEADGKKKPFWKKVPWKKVAYNRLTEASSWATGACQSS